MIYISKKLKYITLVNFASILFFILLSFSNKVLADSISLKIETSPISGFMVLNNLAPGDEESAILSVKNRGNKDFLFSVSARKEAGSDTLYNYLSLKIEQGGTLISDTNLNNLSNLSLGPLVVNDSKEITFKVKLPLDADNQYQGLSTTVAFDFVATAEGNENPPDDPKNPDDPEDPPNPPDDPKQPDPPVTPPEEPKKPDLPMTPPEAPKQPEQPNLPVEPPSLPIEPTKPQPEPIPTETITQVTEPVLNDSGIDLPATSSPWYNLLVISGGVLLFSTFAFLKMIMKKR